MDVLADKGYFKGPEILACANAGITTYLPKTDTSGNQVKELFGRRDFNYTKDEDVYVYLAGERLISGFQTIERETLGRAATEINLPL